MIRYAYLNSCKMQLNFRSGWTVQLLLHSYCRLFLRCNLDVREIRWTNVLKKDWTMRELYVVFQIAYSLTDTPSKGNKPNPVSGPRSFWGGGIPHSLVPGNFQGYPSLWSQLSSGKGVGTLVLAGRVTPPPNLGLGYPLTPGRTSHGQDTLQAVLLLHFDARGYSFCSGGETGLCF